MAIARQVPRCPKCGEPTAKAIYKDQSDVPFFMKIIGDTFIRWESISHTCKDEVPVHVGYKTGSNIYGECSEHMGFNMDNCPMHAQFQPPVAVPTDNSREDIQEFLSYVKDERDSFYEVIQAQQWDNDLRTCVDSFLICFDQMKDRLSKQTQSPVQEAVDGYSREDMGKAIDLLKGFVNAYEVLKYNINPDLIQMTTKFLNTLTTPTQQYIKSLNK